MQMYDIIEKKRDGFEHTKDELAYVIKGAVSGEIPDYKLTAWLMAVYLRGMTPRETAWLTEEMINSGDKADMTKIDGLTVDKHSTGGVGDKTTLVIVPIAASLGCKVAKMSGRGLGHTGGTVDKLESIPGFRTDLSTEEFFKAVNDVGAAMIGQSGNFAPADKKLYALRDVTATVSSLPLIASSIMSKKIASGSDCIVLDVKYGKGAFMKTKEDAQKLADEMVSIGKTFGKRMSAVITCMDSPLGTAVGNSLEVIEAVRVLKDEQHDELYDVCVELASHMVSLTKGIDLEECRELVRREISSGRAFEKLKEIVKAQGGDTRYLDNTELFPKAAYEHEIRSDSDFTLTQLNAELIGKASVRLGAGRKDVGEEIDHSAGIILSAKQGELVKKGDLIATFYTNDPTKIKEAEELFFESIEVG